MPYPYLWVLSEGIAGLQGVRQVLGETLSPSVPLLCLAARGIAGVLGSGGLLLCFPERLHQIEGWECCCPASLHCSGVLLGAVELL